MSFDSDFADPPREFSLMPFWFWNDRLDADELIRQIDAFERNGIYGFVIHPRVGLPRDCGWMSETLLGFYHVAIDEAAKRGMHVILYDEGMYPSGSSCGQVVAKYPDLACRCLALHDDGDALPPTAIVVQRFTDAEGHPKLIVDRPANAYIRGLHYLGGGDAEEDGKEDEPPAGDILNPRTADAIIELVYNVFAREFGRHFRMAGDSCRGDACVAQGRRFAHAGDAGVAPTKTVISSAAPTVLGIFTDEPNPLGKCREKNVFPYTTGILPELLRLTGQDFAADLPKLWDKTDPAADAFREAYRHAVRLRLEETWYKPLSDWCERNSTSLCGHPDRGDEIGVQRHFQIPGQDLVWRFVEPGKPSALEGPESTQAKCTASAMVHSGRRRNSNEFAGAYGHETTFAEIQWLANWCLIRGVNLLIPHAFYYSVRGPRRDERPPQIGPHTPEWDTPAFKQWADHCRRVCWLNTDSTPVVDIAILTHADRCPWRAAKILLQHQRDFHYLDTATLLEAGRLDGPTLVVGDMHYACVVIDGDDELPTQVAEKLRPLAACGRVVRLGSGDRSTKGQQAFIDALPTASRLFTTRKDAENLRIRTVLKAGREIVMAFNESPEVALEVTVSGIMPDGMGLRNATTSSGPNGVKTLDLGPGQLLRL